MPESMQFSESEKTEKMKEDVKNVIEKLKELQEVLAEKYEIQAKTDDLPKNLTGSTESLEQFKKDYIAKSAEYEAEKQKVSSLRLELDETERIKESSEKGMDAITTHREYEMLDKQISDATEKGNALRKELQKEEKNLEKLRDSLDEEKAIIDATEKDVNEAKEQLQQELDKNNARIASLSETEKQMSEGIDEEIVKKFQRIIQRNSKGIVAVKGKVCDGCHMILPAQFANEVHRGLKILFCPYCSRILYYEDAPEDETIDFAMDAGSLADFDDDLLDGDRFDSDGLDGNEDYEETDDVSEGMQSSVDFD